MFNQTPSERLRGDVADRERIYVAGPLFNPAQVALLERLEEIIMAAGHEHFSPRKLYDGKAAVAKTYVEAKKVFENNVNPLVNFATTILCVMDYLMPKDVTLCIGRPDGSSAGGIAWEKLSIPDSGMVWEMGFVTGLKARKNGNGESHCSVSHTPRVLMYYDTPPVRGPNIMLAQCAAKVLCGRDDLTKFLTLPFDARWKMPGIRLGREESL